MYRVRKERERESDVRSYCLEGGVINRGRFKGAFPITEAARVSGGMAKQSGISRISSFSLSRFTRFIERTEYAQLNYLRDAVLHKV